ncbi:efflux RND transporter permease subunit [Pseudoduganella sp. RAF53_2]|uniref:efflux RND transporter permease subunit n=1 Tax=unclassified Pseudoduganella TaxID=2637179 RepID=UPI003F98F3AC
MAKFFIERPIFAIVIAILIMLGGVLAIFALPIEQYPPVAPPTVQISTTYPGASATTVQDTVVQVIEQQMSGLDNLLYMSSSSDDTGQSTTTLTFATGTNPDIAQVQVQNKLQLAVPLLPAQVQQSGVRVTKSTNSFLMVLGFVSTDNSMSKFDIANYVVSHVQDPLSRVNGVGNMNVFGTQYAMRIWLDPAKLNSYSLTPTDVTAAIQAQNVQISGGQLGAAPAVKNQQLNATITESTLLRTPEDFGNIFLKVQADGSQVRLRDVARINLGAENFNVDNKYSGQAASGIGIQLAPGANALDTGNAVRARIAELEPYFPHGLKVVYPNDVTPFVKISIEEVVKTLIEGIVLVFFVMYLFLQSFRATLIPSITVPVVLLGTFGVMSALGFTINTLSMFGMVLAIGLLVDDAIVVVENVERVMHDDGLPPLEATRKAMGQIGSALVGVAVVLSAVFVPMAFSAGTVGAIYRQFSLTIISSMVLSVFVALSLTPALCATLLKPSSGDHYEKKGFFGWFNRYFDKGRDQYQSGVGHVIARAGRWAIIYAAVIGAVVLMFMRLPTSFLPDEDQGFIYVQVQTPPGATQARTGAALDDVSDYLLHEEAAIVDATFVVNGNNAFGRGQNQGQIFVRLKDWSERTAPGTSAAELSARISKHFAGYKDALITPTSPPPIRGLGTAAGFDFELEDRGGLGHAALAKARDQLLAMAKKDPMIAGVRFAGQQDNPAFKINIDREKAAALGVNASDVDQAFSVLWGSRYVNNFLDTDNRIKKVYVQADAQYRMNPEDLSQLYVRNASGTMVPFSSFATTQWTYGPPQLQRYNGVEAMEIQGQATPGHSSGEAMLAMEALAKQLPSGIGFEWTGVSLQQQQSGSQAPLLYALSILVVFLSLAALYESWSIPLSVILVVPIGVLGALAATGVRGLPNDVFFQVGLLTTIGLSAKNAILIVEFARELQAKGMAAKDAAIEAARMRMRPIVMTSMAFVLGVLPLALAHGAGSASQIAIGTGVIGGMLTATFLATFMIPMFFVVVSDKLARSRPAAPAALAGGPQHG